jgi:hypothetical protein
MATCAPHAMMHSPAIPCTVFFRMENDREKRHALLGKMGDHLNGPGRSQPLVKLMTCCMFQMRY